MNNYYMVQLSPLVLFMSKFYSYIDYLILIFFLSFLIQYHGGTNFDRTNGAFVATSYDYDGVIDEYGKHT